MSEDFSKTGSADLAAYALDELGRAVSSWTKRGTLDTKAAANAKRALEQLEKRLRDSEATASR